MVAPSRRKAESVKLTDVLWLKICCEKQKVKGKEAHIYRDNDTKDEEALRFEWLTIKNAPRTLRIYDPRLAFQLECISQNLKLDHHSMDPF